MIRPGRFFRAKSRSIKLQLGLWTTAASAISSRERQVVAERRRIVRFRSRGILAESQEILSALLEAR